jgi:hypothetical protein
VARRIFLIATEESGDRLGANLMKVLRQRLGGAVRFEGVGGRTMAREGLHSLFPIEELSVVGLAEVVRQAPAILARIRRTSAAVLQASPDILVIIDSPDFTHRVAKRVRARDPSIPIIDYVSPSVWAWRPGRARAMCRYVDHVLGLLPFEPEAYRRPAAARRCGAGPARPDPSGAAGAARKPPQRDPTSHGGVRRELRAAAATGYGIRIDPAHHGSLAGSGHGRHQALAGAAPDRHR